MKSLEESIITETNRIKDQIIGFVQKIVHSPSLPGKEDKVQDLVSKQLATQSLDVDIIPIKKKDLIKHPAFNDDEISYENRLDVIGTWRGDNKQENKSMYHSLILNGHVDVVSPGNQSYWKDDPFSGKIIENKLFGRGACDMKAGLSTGIFAIKVLQNLGFQPIKDVIIQSVVGEESGGCGTLTAIMKGFLADAAIIMEPTNLNIYPIHSGVLTFRIKLRGKSVHAAMKNRGISSIEKFIPIFKALNNLDLQRHVNYNNPMYDNPSNIAPISIGTLRSGEWHSTVPDELTAEGRFGIFPGESVLQAKTTFEETISAVAKKDEWLRLNPPIIDWIEGQFEPGETNLDEPIIFYLKNSHQAILGSPPKFKAATYGSDLRLFTNHAKIPAILYGPGDVLNAHGVDEYIIIDEIITATKVLALTIANWSGIKRE